MASCRLEDHRLVARLLDGRRALALDAEEARDEKAQVGRDTDEEV